MKNKLYILSAVLTLSAMLGMLLFPAAANAATFTAIASGSWSSSATWAGGVAPGSTISASDEVIINAGVTVNADTDINVDGTLTVLLAGTLDAGANAIAVANGTVTGAGEIIVDEITVASSAALLFAGSIDAETFVNNGATVALAATTSVASELQLNGGSIAVGSGAGLGLESGTTVVMNGGTLSLSGGLLTATESYSVEYQGSGNTTIGVEASGSGLSSLEVNLGNANTELALDGNLMLNGELTINQGTVVVGNNSLLVNGIIDASANGSIDASAGSTVSVTTSGSGMIDLNFADSPETIGTLSINAGSNASAELNGDLIVDTEFDLSSGTFSFNGNSLTVNGDFNGSGEFEAGAGSDITISGSGSITGGLMFAAGGQAMEDVTINLTNGQTIEFGGSGMVSGMFDFQNGTIDLQSGSSLSLDGSASFGASSEFDGDANADLSINTSNSVTGEITFSNGSATVNDFTVSIAGNGSVSLGSDLGVNGDLDLANGSLDVNGNTLMINGDISSTGSGSISVDGNSDIEIHADGNVSGGLNFTSGSSTMGNLVIDIDNGGSVMLGSDAGVSGTLDLQNGFIALGGSDLMVSGNVNGGTDGSYVITNGQGSLMLDLEATTEAFFAVGTEVSYAPATLMQAAGSANGTFGVSVANDVYAEGFAGAEMSAWGSMVDHTWNVTSELTSNIDVEMTLEWDAAAEVNAFDRADAYISHYVNGAWDVAATSSATLNAEGRYEITRSGFTSLSPFAVFDGATAVGVDEAEELTVSFFPNPAADVVTYNLAGQNGNTNIDLFDASGKVVASEIAQGTQGTLDVSTLPAGIYTMRITNEQSVTTARMVKQ